MANGVRWFLVATFSGRRRSRCGITVVHSSVGSAKVHVYGKFSVQPSLFTSDLRKYCLCWGSWLSSHRSWSLLYICHSYTLLAVWSHCKPPMSFKQTWQRRHVYGKFSFQPSLFTSDCCLSLLRSLKRVAENSVQIKLSLQWVLC